MPPSRTAYAVGAAGDGEGGRVAGIGVGRGEREDVSYVLVDRGVPLEVKAGVSSLRSWTVTVTVIVSVLAPSVTWITTAQVLELSPAPQPGVSKSGAEEKASMPPAPTLNRSWSTLAAFWAAVRIE